MALRLARFNASLDGAPRPAYAYSFFTGVPAPAGAGLALFPLFLGLEAQTLAGDGWRRGAAPASVRRWCCWARPAAGLDAAGLELQELQGAGGVRAAGAGRHRAYAAVLIADPWAALAAAGFIYLGMLPFSVRSFRRLELEAEAPHDDVREIA